MERSEFLAVWGKLSSLERHTIALMAAGYTEPIIAHIDCVTLSAIKMRKHRIYAKFDLKKVRHWQKQSILIEAFLHHANQANQAKQLTKRKSK